MYLRDSVDEAQMRVRLDGMRVEHRDLDDAIAALILSPSRSVADRASQAAQAEAPRRDSRVRRHADPGHHRLNDEDRALS